MCIRDRIVVVDTLGFESVKDSLFGDTGRYKTMMNIPIEGLKEKGISDKFELKAGEIEKSNSMIPVFEVRVSKDVLLYDQKRDYVIKEKQIISIDEVNGEYLVVGAMDQVKSSGNWPKSYGANDQ